MSGDKSSMHVNRAYTEGNPSPLYSKEYGSGLYAHLREQENEISALQQQITRAYINAMDEKQKEYITSVSKELAQRKGNLDDNLSLASSLKQLYDELQWKIRSLDASPFLFTS
ncbi:hypothetical protein Droror1_Dr00007168 [Drosera rotundifolia]